VIDGVVLEETGFKNPFNSIAFKGSLEPSHETHPVPETQPRIYDSSGHLDIRERRKAMVERMVKARVGLEIFGSLEITKLIIYENKEIKALDDISLLQVIGDAKDIKQTFINNVLMYMVNFKISKIDGIGLIEVTKLLIFNTKF
jgi:hypothetical protein